MDCHCYANCDNSYFFVQAYVSLIYFNPIHILCILNFQRSREWFLGANLQWGINDYPKMQLKREMIFTFSDVLGNVRLCFQFEKFVTLDSL